MDFTQIVIKIQKDLSSRMKLIQRINNHKPIDQSFSQITK